MVAQKKSPSKSTKKRTSSRSQSKSIIPKRNKLLVSLAAALVVVAAGIWLVATYAASATGTVKALGKCMDNAYGVKKNNNPVQLYGCDNTDTQIWTFASDNTIRFGSSSKGGYCLNVKGAAKTSMSEVALWQCTSDTNSAYFKSQKWTLRKDGSILNTNSGMCLDVKYGGTAEGTPIWLWPCNGTAAQKWTAPTGMAAPNPAPAPTPSPVPTPTPTPTPTPPSTSSCAFPNYPNASCTGVPAGTQLTVHQGDMTISTAGKIIENQDIRGCVVVNAPGVIIRRSKISCPSNITVGSFNGRYTGARLLLEEVEINCQYTPGTAVGDKNVTVRKANVYGCENGFDVDGEFTIEDSYIHDLSQRAENHSDGIQTNENASNINVTHNSIFVQGGTSAMITHPNGNSNVFITNNLLAGGAYTLYCPRDNSTNFWVKDNRFSTSLYPKGGAYGPWVHCEKLPAFQVVGNSWFETNQPLQP